MPAARTRTAKPRKIKPPAEVRQDMSAPEPVQAGHIALIIMTKLGAESWRGVREWIKANGDPRQKVVLTEHQQRILDDYAHLLPYIAKRPKVIVIACPACGRYGLSPSASSARCTFTLGCEGKLISSKMTSARASSAH